MVGLQGYGICNFPQSEKKIPEFEKKLRSKIYLKNKQSIHVVFLTDSQEVTGLNTVRVKFSHKSAEIFFFGGDRFPGLSSQKNLAFWSQNN